MIITTARATAINSVHSVRRQKANVLGRRHISTYTHGESRLDWTGDCSSRRVGTFRSWMDRSPSFPRVAGSDHYGRPAAARRPVESTRVGIQRYDDRHRRQLFYGSTATSNQRLIIQRGNCATSLYDRATRHARRRRQRRRRNFC